MLLFFMKSGHIELLDMCTSLLSWQEFCNVGGPLTLGLRSHAEGMVPTNLEGTGGRGLTGESANRAV